jgi:hypothetical protein
MSDKVQAGQLLFFCLDHFHPGEDGIVNAVLDDPSRYFVAPDTGCPECPKCGRQVSAAVVPDDKTLPPSVVAAVKRAERDLTNSPTGPGPQARFAVQASR